MKLRILFASIALLSLSACANTHRPASLTLSPVSFSELTGWQDDHVSEAIPALLRSCTILAEKPPFRIADMTADWRPACAALENLPAGDDAAARFFFETTFQPYAASGPDGDEGLFTGYYEAELHGSWKRGGKYRTPLYARPRDLVTADLADFSPDLKGHHIVGKVENGKLKPYDDRTAIDNHSLRRRAHVLLWVDDPVDAFFLAVQGSGRIIMKNGGAVQVGYDSQNGRSYVAIGRVLAEAGDILRPVTMQKIRAWLNEHHEQAKTVMETNPSYIFFRLVKGEGPIGAETVPLTPGRSLAVDPAYLQLGTPLWLDTQDGQSQPLQRLVVAQDTGGAIKGGVRGDFFWGYGPNAETQAGMMQNKGKYFVLLPKSSAP